ncbi:glutathione S-transferase family protein [Sphingomonas immobilis]|uniref:Glutathione S-transferase family protein n=1 Tax=Sphingomonas immobilis TaxID=3063997 RepID=A0ABT9A2G3_9SPHN|nr:glutathione S-transferase family protein [Sphingomonas sp. CA1-15]MDO7844021.1 glutathione S-transferase family protein [Sphingomonas sp. CA1-15]
MTIQLFAHPLSSYCHKVQIALYERGIAFEPQMIAPDEPEIYARFASLWPMAKMPLLLDGERAVAESSIIIDYADRLGSGPPMVPAEAEAALEARFMDRCFDDYVMTPMQAIVAERIRPAGNADSFGVEQAKALLDKSYAWLEGKLAGREWAAGDTFGIADCAAAPALWYARHVRPFDAWPVLSAYHARLEARPSVARTRKEAEPYWAMFPFSSGGPA